MAEYMNILDYVKNSKAPDMIQMLDDTFKGVIDEKVSEADIKTDQEKIANRVHELYLAKLIYKGEMVLAEANQFRNTAKLPNIDFSKIKFVDGWKYSVESVDPVETVPAEAPVEETAKPVDEVTTPIPEEVGTEVAADEPGVTFSFINVTLIKTDHIIRQPNDDELAGFVEEISQEDLIHPIEVRPVEGGFELIAGSRRLQAVKQLGRKTIKAVIGDYSDTEAFIRQGAENCHRKDFNTWEMLDFISQGLDKGLKQRELARVLNMAESNLSNLVKVTRDINESVFTDLKATQPNITRDVLVELSKLTEAEQIESLEDASTGTPLNVASVKEHSAATSKPEPGGNLSDPVEQDSEPLEDTLVTFDCVDVDILAEEMLALLNLRTDEPLREITIGHLTNLQDKITEMLNA